MALSIRSRLTLWYALVLLVAFAVFGGSMWFALEHRLMASVDERLAQRIQGVGNALGATAEIQSREQLEKELAEFVAEIPDGTLIQLRDRAGRVLLPNARHAAVPADARKLTGQMQSAGETWDVLLALPLEEQRAILRDFRRLLFLLMPAALALACAGGYWLSTRALRPVDEITTVARSITLQNLSKRIAVAPTGDELERMGRTWNEVLERLDLAVQRIRRFTADASHELRTPLALIRATADLALRKERDAGEYRAALREIHGQAEVMTALTESLLTIARADFEGFQMPLAATDLGELVAAEVRHNQPMAAGKGVKLSAATTATPMVQANADGIERLLRILIDNAIRHTPAGGEVSVSAAPVADGVRLTVADTGEGIAPNDLPYIFERFYRADPVRASGGGFGLGLSIAQAIAQAHHSAITVESAPGAGARFSMLVAHASACSVDTRVDVLHSAGPIDTSVDAAR
jgi:heavy metal sensor kinase